MRIHRVRGLLMAAAAAAIVVSAIAASSASAVLLTLPNGQTVSYQPLRSAASQFSRFDNAFGNMDYNGGPVMPSNTNYMVLWSPNGLSAYPPEYVRGVARYFRDLARDSGGNQNVDSIAPQYNDLTGARANYDVTFGGVLLAIARAANTGISAVVDGNGRVRALAGLNKMGVIDAPLPQRRTGVPDSVDSSAVTGAPWRNRTPMPSSCCRRPRASL